MYYVYQSQLVVKQILIKQNNVGLGGLCLLGTDTVYVTWQSILVPYSSQEDDDLHQGTVLRMF